MNNSGVEILGRRYQILSKLGQGGMGAVYRAFDRLNQEVVALKRVLPADAEVTASTDGNSSTDVRMAMANEFETLASLRHPNIITVLDYGFDERQSPYFTMTLLDNPHTITEAARGAKFTKKIDLLIEMLHALAYLHQRGILHRDLKPDNVLVTSDAEQAVKVLDFGLAALRESQNEDEFLVGTLAYMAPEVLQGMGGTVAADLYSVGMIAYEIVAGGHPYAGLTPHEIIQTILSKPIDVSQLDIELEVAQIIERLLDKIPENRYQSAEEVISALSAAVNHPIIHETVAIRESYLQAARFVGRQSEMKLLADDLHKAIQGAGSAWLIGGEVGVGKSRMLNELRIRALVRGAVVLQGQAIPEGGLSYQVWLDALRKLILFTELTHIEAGVLKQVVFDIEDLLGHPVEDAPELEGQAGQQRLLNTIAGIFRKQTQPILLILEDLHWATESLDVVRYLAPLTAELPLLMVADYRDDERPTMPAEMPGMKLMKLGRLPQNDIETLAASILGEIGHQPELIDLLRKETEGNVFFLIEIIRALADEAGQLREIASMTLPRSVVSGGIQRILARRLSYVPANALELLRIAAVAGRRIELKLLGTAAPDEDLDDWLTACSNVAVLDLQDGHWRFAHDRLREAVLESLEPQERTNLHRRVARAIQTAYAEDMNEYAGMISDHYEQAGDLNHALEWQMRAARHAQETYAPATAILYYRKALTYWEKQDLHAFGAEAGRIEAYEGLGKMLNWQAHYADAEQVYRNMLEATLESGNITAGARARIGIAEARVRQGDIRSAIEFATQAEEIARNADASHELSAALWMRGWSLMRMGDTATALSLGEEVYQLSEALGNERQMAQSLNLIGVAHLVGGRYAPASEALDRALAITERLGDRGPAIAMMNNLGVIAESRGDYPRALHYYQDALKVARELGNRDAELVYLTNVGGVQVMIGDYMTAENTLRHVLTMVGDGTFSSLSDVYRSLAESLLGQGDFNEAMEAADMALILGRENEAAEYVAAAWRVIGTIAMHSGIPMLVEGEEEYDAPACFEESLRISRDNHLDTQEARTLREWAIYHLNMGDSGAAETLWNESRAIFERLGADFEVARMGSLRG